MLGAENELTSSNEKKLTVSLSPQTVQKAKALAAKRSTSLSELLTRRIEALVDPNEAYANAHWAALELMERGFHMGGIPHGRDSFRRPAELAFALLILSQTLTRNASPRLYYVMGAGLNKANSLCRPQWSAQVCLRPLATSRIIRKICSPTC